MRESTVARVYAETLLELARERDAVAEVADEVAVLRGVLAATPRLQRLLESPEVTADEKIGVLRRSLGSHLSRETVRFLEVLVLRGRQDLLPLVFEGFEALVADLRNRETVRVTSAVPLGDEIRRRLVETFARATGREIVLHEALDPGLLGGLVVQVGDTRVDGSLRTRLRNLRERMLRGARAATVVP